MRWIYLALGIAAGACLPTQAAINAQLRMAVGSPGAASGGVRRPRCERARFAGDLRRIEGAYFPRRRMVLDREAPRNSIG